MTVGREASCDVTLRDSKVSREHFRISKHKEGFTVEDLGSRNGTFLNGQRIQERGKRPFTRPWMREGDVLTYQLQREGQVG